MRRAWSASASTTSSACYFSPHVMRALTLMRLEEGLGLGGRKITVSTAGYLPGIHKLIAEDLNVGLAISLNSTTDEIREQLMPINRKWQIADLLAAAREFFDRPVPRSGFRLAAGKSRSDFGG